MFKTFNVTNEFGTQLKNVIFDQVEGGWYALLDPSSPFASVMLNESLTMGCWNPQFVEDRYYSANWFGVVVSEVK